MNGKKRKVYIDVAKGFAILLVILGHMNRFFAYEGRLMQVVYSVQLPLFLIVGGYWMRVKDGETPGQFFTKKFYRLLQPYFFYGFLSIIYAWPGNQEGFVHYFSGLLWGIGINDYLPNLPIWFLPMFFLANCWFYLALLLGKKGRNLKEQLLLEAGAVAVLMSVGLIINDPFSRLPWGFELSLIIQGFFFAGHLWRIGEERFFPEGRVSAKQKRILVLMLFPVFAVWPECGLVWEYRALELLSGGICRVLSFAFCRGDNGRVQAACLDILAFWGKQHGGYGCPCACIDMDGRGDYAVNAPGD